LILCHCDTTDIMVELLIERTAIEIVSNDLVEGGLGDPQKLHNQKCVLPNYLLLVLHCLFSLLDKFLPIAADVGILMDV
jgi:hypothetical protein